MCIKVALLDVVRVGKCDGGVDRFAPRVECEAEELEGHVHKLFPVC